MQYSNTLYLWHSQVLLRVIASNCSMTCPVFLVELVGDRKVMTSIFGFSIFFLRFVCEEEISIMFHPSIVLVVVWSCENYLCYDCTLHYMLLCWDFFNALSILTLLPNLCHLVLVSGMARRRLSALCKWTRLYFVIWHCTLHCIRVWKT